MSTTRGFLLPAYAAGDELEAVTLTEADRRVEDDTYTPTLTATGGTPAIGADGYLTGWWHRVGLLETVWIDILLSGAGVSLVGTSWRIGLPHDADLTRHTAGILNASGDLVGNYQTHSSTSSQALAGGFLLSGTAELIMYASGSTSSRGSADFTTTARIKGKVQYYVDAAEF